MKYLLAASAIFLICYCSGRTTKKEAKVYKDRMANTVFSGAPLVGLPATERSLSRSQTEERYG